MHFSSFVVLALACVAQTVKGSPTDSGATSAAAVSACVGAHCDVSTTHGSAEHYAPESLYTAVREAVLTSDPTARRGCDKCCLLCVAVYCTVEIVGQACQAED
ncbi:hypothetical protein DFH06DRAFT_1135804 [Mycena polygramma]|nr:hypothetical protein DFH06DRAFT_1135804 [Mycena polygramma]